MVTLEELAVRLEQLETQLALHRLAADYCIGADQEDLERFSEIWTADAVWDAAGDDLDDEEHRFRGAEAITAAVQGQWATFPRMQHATANHVIDRDEVDPDRARGRCDVVVTVQLPDGRWVIGGGVYEDRYQRQYGVWRIASRVVRRPFDLQPLPASHGIVGI
jgi:hypothetical protein